MNIFNEIRMGTRVFYSQTWFCSCIVMFTCTYLLSQVNFTLASRFIDNNIDLFNFSVKNCDFILVCVYISQFDYLFISFFINYYVRISHRAKQNILIIFIAFKNITFTISLSICGFQSRFVSKRLIDFVTVHCFSSCGRFELKT